MMDFLYDLGDYFSEIIPGCQPNVRLHTLGKLDHYFTSRLQGFYHL